MCEASICIRPVSPVVCSRISVFLSLPSLCLPRSNKSKCERLLAHIHKSHSNHGPHRGPLAHERNRYERRTKFIEPKNEINPSCKRPFSLNTRALSHTLMVKRITIKSYVYTTPTHHLAIKPRRFFFVGFFPSSAVLGAGRMEVEARHRCDEWNKAVGDRKNSIRIVLDGNTYLGWPGLGMAGLAWLQDGIFARR